MSRQTFPLKIEIPKIEEDVVCYRFRWIRPIPLPPYSANVYYQLLYVDNRGYVIFGDYIDSNFISFQLWIYDVNGNIVSQILLPSLNWGPSKVSSWGSNVGYGQVSTTSYLIITEDVPPVAHVIRNGREIWVLDLSKDGIQGKRFLLLAISPNGKYIASTIGDVNRVTDDHIVLYEGYSDRSMCPTPPS